MNRQAEVRLLTHMESFDAGRHEESFAIRFYYGAPLNGRVGFVDGQPHLPQFLQLPVGEFQLARQMIHFIIGLRVERLRLLIILLFIDLAFVLQPLFDAILEIVYYRLMLANSRFQNFMFVVGVFHTLIQLSTRSAHGPPNPMTVISQFPDFGHASTPREERY